MTNKLKTLAVVATVALSAGFASDAKALDYGYGFVAPVASSNYSSNIASIQTSLASLGYNVGRFGATGQMNDSTRSAIRQFQADIGLKADGVVGVRTAEALNAMNTDNNWRYNVSYRQPTQYYYAPTPAPVYYAPTTTARSNGIYW